MDEKCCRRALTFSTPLATLTSWNHCTPRGGLNTSWRPNPQCAESLFTRIAQSSDDEANYVIARDRTCYALLNTYPYTGGHLMVVPYKQTPDLNGLTDEELADLLKLTRRCQNALRA